MYVVGLGFSGFSEDGTPDSLELPQPFVLIETILDFREDLGDVEGVEDVEDVEL